MPKIANCRRNGTAKAPIPLEKIVTDLVVLQRFNVLYTKQKIRVHNGLVALAKEHLGYSTGMNEEDRDGLKDKAEKWIERVRQGVFTADPSPEVETLERVMIVNSLSLLNDWQKQQDVNAKKMEKVARLLPVQNWTKQKEQRGFGFKMLAEIVGECGDLNNYPSVRCLWKRMGCAPFSKEIKDEEVTRAGSTWKSQGGLTAEEWEEYGYNPRRRSVVWNVVEPMMRNNVVIGEDGLAEWTGPYRLRYLDAKVSAFASHPEWLWRGCDKCEEWSRSKRKKCPTCGGIGKVCLHAHNHGRLLMAKLLLKNLWREWRNPTAFVPPKKTRKPPDASKFL